MSWTLFNHNYNIIPVLSGGHFCFTCPVLVVSGGKFFKQGFGSERSPYMSNSIIHADPLTGNVIFFGDGFAPGLGSTSTLYPGGLYSVSDDFGATWVQYDVETIPGNWYNGSGTNFLQLAQGMCVHPSGKFTVSMNGTTKTGLIYSTDGGHTWLRESPINQYFNYAQMYAVAPVGEDVWGQNAAPNATNNSGGFWQTDPEGASPITRWNPTPPDLDEGCFNVITMNGRRIGHNQFGNKVVEWDGATTKTETVISGAIGLRHHWAQIDTLNSIFVTESPHTTNETDIRYTKIDMGSTAMVAGSYTQHTITTSFLDTCVENAAIGAGNGYLVACVSERFSGNTSTDQLAMFFSGDGGATWSAQKTCTLSFTPNSASGWGRATRIVWAGGKNWLMAIRDDTSAAGTYQVLTFTLDTAGFGP